MNKPGVLICTHERYEITTANIRSLLIQSVKPFVVLVVSNKTEGDYYRNTFGRDIFVCTYHNQPLGRKFQYGVDVAKEQGVDMLIITGSDDILGRDFIKKSVEYVEAGFEFVSVKQWFIYHQQILYLYEYMPQIPLGTRVYSKSLLDRIEWKLFNPSADRKLDDWGFMRVLRAGGKIKIVDNALDSGYHVISVKGQWAMLNPFFKMQNHPNCRLLKKIRDVNQIL